jgi:Family of unknown function (DUF6275)
MGYTSHGRHIPGTLKGAGTVGEPTACSGIETCPRCKREIESHTMHKRMVGENTDFQVRAKLLVRDYVTKVQDQNHPDIIVPEPFTVYVVWFAKTLGNWKALLSTTLSDGKYYELTYDGEKKTTYFDVYSKVDNFPIPDEE